jgi:hypothetical protein
MGGTGIFPPLLTTSPFTNTSGNCASAGMGGQSASNKSK